jgi:hypothetical protein
VHRGAATNPGSGAVDLYTGDLELAPLWTWVLRRNRTLGESQAYEVARALLNSRRFRTQTCGFLAGD